MKTILPIRLSRRRHFTPRTNRASNQYDVFANVRQVLIPCRSSSRTCSPIALQSISHCKSNYSHMQHHSYIIHTNSKPYIIMSRMFTGVIIALTFHDSALLNWLCNTPKTALQLHPAAIKCALCVRVCAASQLCESLCALVLAIGAIGAIDSGGWSMLSSFNSGANNWRNILFATFALSRECVLCVVKLCIGICGPTYKPASDRMMGLAYVAHKLPEPSMYEIERERRYSEGEPMQCRRPAGQRDGMQRFIHYVCECA